MNTSNLQVAFTIYASYLKHNDISERMGFAPSYTRYSDEVLHNGRLFGHDEWGIGTDFESSTDVEVQITKITNILFHKKEVIKSVCNQYNAKCCFIITVNVENDIFPSLGLTAEFMKFASEINAEVGFDIYYFG